MFSPDFITTPSSKDAEVDHVSCVELPDRPTGGTSFQSSMLYLDMDSPQRRVSDDAREGIAKERKMSFASGVRMYPRAIRWSVILSLTIVMIAYDKMMVGGSFGAPAFQRQFGSLIQGGDEVKYDLSAPWQSALVNAGFATETLALLVNGVLTDRYGYKKVVVGALIFTNLVILLSFFAKTRELLLASQILSGTYYHCLGSTLLSNAGLPWGCFETLSATYAAEVLPVALRTYLLANVNMVSLPLCEECKMLARVIFNCLHNNGTS